MTVGQSRSFPSLWSPSWLWPLRWWWWCLCRRDADVYCCGGLLPRTCEVVVLLLLAMVLVVLLLLGLLLLSVRLVCCLDTSAASMAANSVMPRSARSFFSSLLLHSKIKWPLSSSTRTACFGCAAGKLAVECWQAHEHVRVLPRYKGTLSCL